MTSTALVLAILQATAPVEVLPVDRVMAAFEAEIPRLVEVMAQTDAELDRLGPVEAGWATSGQSKDSAIIAGNGNSEQHVLGEWERGGHSVSTPGDRPLAVPQGMRRYTVREYGGPVGYHSYYRISPGIVIHTFGSNRQIGNAGCSGAEGMEVISRGAWQDWSREDALAAFGVARSTRDDRRTYCVVYRPTGDGRFREQAYTPNGRPFLVVNEDVQAFTVTSRAEAAARIFDSRMPQPAAD